MGYVCKPGVIERRLNARIRHIRVTRGWVVLLAGGLLCFCRCRLLRWHPEVVERGWGGRDESNELMLAIVAKAGEAEHPVAHSRSPCQRVMLTNTSSPLAALPNSGLASLSFIFLLDFSLDKRNNDAERQR